MKNIAYAGSFDIFTNGHLWVVKSALEISENLIIFVADNPAKQYYFSKENRKRIIENVIKDEGLDDCVTVEISSNEYVATRILEYGITHMIRGIRNGVDFDQEKLIQRANYMMFGGVQTIFVMPPSELESVSSSFVKGLIGPEYWASYVKKLIPDASWKALIRLKVSDILKNEISFSEEDKKIINEDYLKNSSKNIIVDFILFVFKNHENNRFYHDLSHILNMLEYCINHKTFNVNILIAIFLHDLIQRNNEHYLKDYEKYGISNEDWQASYEHNSSLFSKYFSKYLNMNTGTTVENSVIQNYIMATSHFCKCPGKDFSTEGSIIKADLAILASPYNIYLEYAKNIRKEYSMFNDEKYNHGRISVLGKLQKDIETLPFLDESFKIKALNNIIKEENLIKNGEK